jgi:hypothetical protein
MGRGCEIPVSHQGHTGKGGGHIGANSCKVIICRCAVAIEAFTPKSLVDRVCTCFHCSNTRLRYIAARTGVRSDVSTPFKTSREAAKYARLARGSLVQHALLEQCGAEVPDLDTFRSLVIHDYHVGLG